MTQTQGKGYRIPSILQSFNPSEEYEMRGLNPYQIIGHQTRPRSLRSLDLNPVSEPDASHAR